MRTINRVTGFLILLFIIALIAFAAHSIWSIYVRIPNLREDIREQTAGAVARWFPVGEGGGFTYDLEVDSQKDICIIKNLNVDKGAGGILDGIKFASYNIKIDSIAIAVIPESSGLK